MQSWLNRAIAALQSQRIMPSRDVMPVQTPNGTQLFIKTNPGGSQGTSLPVWL
jgi:hypothetical protein